jgi:hypothetical protein
MTMMMTIMYMNMKMEEKEDWQDGAMTFESTDETGGLRPVVYRQVAALGGDMNWN